MISLQFCTGRIPALVACRIASCPVCLRCFGVSRNPKPACIVARSPPAGADLAHLETAGGTSSFPPSGSGKNDGRIRLSCKRTVRPSLQPHARCLPEAVELRPFAPHNYREFGLAELLDEERKARILQEALSEA